MTRWRYTVRRCNSRSAADVLNAVTIGGVTGIALFTPARRGLAHWPDRLRAATQTMSLARTETMQPSPLDDATTENPSVGESHARVRPSSRFAGSEHLLDTRDALRALREEKSPRSSGHRQIALVHEGPVRLVLFAFDAGGRIPQHKASGWVTIQVVRGTLHVQTHEQHYELSEGQILAMAPNVMHDVHASEEADMLLGVYPQDLTPTEST